MKRLPVILITLLLAVRRTSLPRARSTPASPPNAPRWQASKPNARCSTTRAPCIRGSSRTSPGAAPFAAWNSRPFMKAMRASMPAAGRIVPLTQTMIQVMNVQTAEAQVRPLKKTLTVAGTIDDNATRHRVLSAYIPGRIEKLYVNYIGAEVKEGEPLAEFYSPTLLQAEREYRTLTGELRAHRLRLRQMGLPPRRSKRSQTNPRQTDFANPRAHQRHRGGAESLRRPVRAGRREAVRNRGLLDHVVSVSRLRTGPAVDQARAQRSTSPRRRIRAGPSPATIAFIDPNSRRSHPLDQGARRIGKPARRWTPASLLHRLYADGVVHLEAPEVLTVPRTRRHRDRPGSGGVCGSRRRRLRAPRAETRPSRRYAGGSALGLSAGEKVVVNGNLLIDGQAEMNRAFAHQPRSPRLHVHERYPALTDAQTHSRRSSSLEARRRRRRRARRRTTSTSSTRRQRRRHAATAALDGGLRGPRTTWQPLLKAVRGSGHFQKRDDLTAARKAVPSLSATPPSRWLNALRRSDKEFAAVQDLSNVR